MINTNYYKDLYWMMNACMCLSIHIMPLSDISYNNVINVLLLLLLLLLLPLLLLLQLLFFTTA